MTRATKRRPARKSTAAAPAYTTRSTTGNTTKTLSKKQQSIAFDRHRRKCVVCRHPDRDAIEEEFIHWRGPYELALQYKIADYRSLYRHARAAGILLTRRENFHSALDSIVEAAAEARVTGDCVIRAIRAYSCIDRHGRWTEIPSQVSFTSARAIRPAKPAAQSPTVIDISEPEPDPEPEVEFEADEDSETEAGSDPADPGASDTLSGETPQEALAQVPQTQFQIRRQAQLQAEREAHAKYPLPERPSVESLKLMYGDAFRKGCESLKTMRGDPV